MGGKSIMDMRDDYSGATPVGDVYGAAETRELPTVGRDGSDYGSSYGSSMGGGTSGGGQGSTQDVKQTAGRVAEQAQETAGRVMDRVRETATFTLEEQKARAADTLNQFAGSIQRASVDMANAGPLGEYVSTAGYQLQRFSDHLRNREVRDLVVDVERFARRQPALFLGGGVLLGLVAARFIKSSGQQAQGGSQGYDNRTEVETFTTRGNHTTMGTMGTDGYGAGNDGEDTLRSVYRVAPDTDGNGEG
jgi:hypothetical protein